MVRGDALTAAAKRIVLLGIGHTNANVVRQWATDPIPGSTLTCISNFPTATYSGMLPGTLGGQFDDEEMRIDLPKLADRAGATLLLADTCGLDLVDGRIHFSDHDSISFDALSIGVGSVPANSQEHANSPLLIPIKPMQTFLERLETRLQARSSTMGHDPTKIAIVGGGVAGVEIAFCLQEQFTERALHDTRIEIFTSSEHVAAGMSERGVRRIKRLLTKRGNQVHAGHRVTTVGESEIVLDDGCRHVVDAVIWATGAAAPPVLSKLGLRTDDRGFIATGPTLQTLSDPRVFAVGDSGTILQSPSPKAGVYAVRQSPILWHNIRALATGGTMQQFKPQRSFLKLLNTGDGKALLEYGMFVAHARWCWRLKTWIDKRFVSEFQSASHTHVSRARQTQHAR
ncbi:NADH dehydrogenase-like protein YjlD [Allorhodopirellula heiligendammensis]|uniref:NADH dehydrogenase-like protein YjlD n=1 Tax=Allorhodopirellula heiligendammensis TaxID=2714739 RepID=A0A5C6BF92_9BACT|nr:NADH dehydrogenase-like protein YjlD [Allorhodopirellula heiligendammensis]